MLLNEKLLFPQNSTLHLETLIIFFFRTCAFTKQPQCFAVVLDPLVLKEHGRTGMSLYHMGRKDQDA